MSAPIICTKPNEEYLCGGACQHECATLGEPCLLFNIRCNDDCYCIQGYARNSVGVCISEKDCPPKPDNLYYSNSSILI